MSGKFQVDKKLTWLLQTEAKFKFDLGQEKYHNYPNCTDCATECVSEL